jgi:hypothetical protein
MAIPFCPVTIANHSLHSLRTIRARTCTLEGFSCGVGTGFSQGPARWHGAHHGDWSRSGAARDGFASHHGVGAARKRVHGFLRRLGFNRSYVLINTFLYSVFGQGGGTRQIKNAAITAYRNRWIKAILDSSPIEAVVAFGGLAKEAWEQWLKSSDASGRPALPFEPLTHPTWPESSSNSRREHDAAIETLLTRWNEGLQRLKPKITHPDLSTPLSLYGKKFLPTDLPDLPPDDYPLGCRNGC